MYEIALKQGKIDENTDLLNPTFYESNSAFNPATVMPSIFRSSMIVLNEAEKRIGKGSEFKFCS